MPMELGNFIVLEIPEFSLSSNCKIFMQLAKNIPVSHKSGYTNNHNFTLRWNRAPPDSASNSLN